MNLKNSVKELRTAQGLSQTELATAIGCDKKTIQRIERGQSTNIDTAFRLAEYFHCLVDDVFHHDPSS